MSTTVKTTLTFQWVNLSSLNEASIWYYILLAEGGGDLHDVDIILGGGLLYYDAWLQGREEWSKISEKMVT